MTKTLTKEEILGRIIFEDAQKMLLADSEITREHNGISYKMVRNELAVDAMETFAMQQSISFAEWVDRDYCQCDKNSKNKDLWYEIGQIEKGRYSTEELYNLFLQDQNKQP